VGKPDPRVTHSKPYWKSSLSHCIIHHFDYLAPSKKFPGLTQDLSCHQVSLLIQLCTSHIGLNQHLFWICRVESPSCPHCGRIMVELVKHFLLICPKYVHGWHQLRCQLCRNADSLPFLLSNPTVLKPLLKFVNSTGRFNSTFGNLKSTPWCVKQNLLTCSQSSRHHPCSHPFLLPYMVVVPFWVALSFCTISTGSVAFFFISLLSCHVLCLRVVVGSRSDVGWDILAS
jgi:hypothetical protein